MKKFWGILALVALSGVPAMAQSPTPGLEVGGGYTLRVYTSPFTAQRLFMNGWNGTAEYGIKRWLSAAVDFDGAYADTGLNGRYSIYTAMIGPQIYPLGHRKFTLFGHVLVGGGYARYRLPASGGFPITTTGSDSRTYEAGGGLEYARNSRWTIRLVEADYEGSKFFNSGGTSYSNYKYRFTIIYHFSKK